MKTFYIDIDDTIADLLSAWLRRYNKDYNDHLQKKDITEWDMRKFVKPECGEIIYEYLDDPTLYDEVFLLEPEYVVKRTISALKQLGYRVVFATTPVYKNQGRKLQWLYDYGFLESKRFQKDYIEVGDKSLLNGSYGTLLDDGIHNIRAYSGYKILYNQPHNANDFWAPRVDSIQDVLKLGAINMNNGRTKWDI